MAGRCPFVICHLSSVAASLWRDWFVILLILSLSHNALADGGSVQLHSVSGPFDITLFAEPPLPRAGQIDFSVLVQDSKTGQPVLDAVVTLALTPVRVHQNEQPAWYPPSCAVAPPVDLARVPLLHSGAINRLLYGALVVVPAAGIWQVQTEARRGDQHGVVEGTVAIASPSPPIANYWPLFLFPVVVVGLYVLRGRIQRRSTPSMPSTPAAPSTPTAPSTPRAPRMP